MRKIVFVIAVLVTVSVCGCGNSGKGSSDDKSEKKAPPIGVIDVNKPSGDYNIEDKTVSSVTPAASDEPAAALDQLQDYVESPEFMDDVSLPDIPEHDVDLSGMTLSQQNAVKTALNYVDLMAFSKEGLIEQISSEYADGFPREDAEFAVSYLEKNKLVDWNVEAAQCAQNYLDIMSFSRDGLYQQMTSESGDKFTKEQAEYALSQVGY